MVEVKFGDELPDRIEFENENGVLTTQLIEYERRPVKCDECGGIGHDGEACRKKKAEIPKERRKRKKKKVRVLKGVVPSKVMDTKTDQNSKTGM